MDLGDIVPIFALIFFYVLPMILIMLFLAVSYKLIRRFIKEYEKLKKKMESDVQSLGGKILDLMKGLSDVAFLDAVPIILIEYPLILMVLMLLTQHADYMLTHFWDYAYPALGVLSVATMMNVWVHTMYYFFKEVMRV